MIQPIGKNPVSNPKPTARIAISAGMVKPKIAMPMATRSPITAAICTLTLPEAIMMSSSAAGAAAAKVETTALPNGL